MAVQLHHTVGQFHPDQEDWTAYVERLTFYFVANDVKDAGKQKAILLSACGSGTFTLIKNLATPKSLKELSFKDIALMVKEHYQPKPSVIMERFKFNSRVRQPGESIATFVAQLRQLSQKCGFKDLDDQLRDRLVCGIGDQEIQKRLLSESTLDFAKAKDMAIAMESANRFTKDLKPPQEPIQKVTRAHY